MEKLSSDGVPVRADYELRTVPPKHTDVEWRLGIKGVTRDKEGKLRRLGKLVITITEDGNYLARLD